MNRRKKSLESLVKCVAKDNHVRHFDPIDAISHHVVFVVFISLMFLMGLFLFMTSEPGPTQATTFAIYEFEPVTFHKDIASTVSDFINNVRNSEDRPLVLLALYTFWIIIFGLVNMAIYERNLHKEHK